MLANSKCIFNNPPTEGGLCGLQQVKAALKPTAFGKEVMLKAERYCVCPWEVCEGSGGTEWSCVSLLK